MLGDAKMRKKQFLSLQDVQSSQNKIKIDEGF